MVIATAQQFALAVEAAESIDELSNLLDAITGEMGCQFFALSHHVDLPRAPQPAIRIHNYPVEWEEFFDAQRLGPSDPVHRASHLTNVGFPWSRLPQLIVLTRRDEEILARSRRVGLADGFTVPAHIPGESAGSCSFATAHGRTIRTEWLPLAQFVGAAAFEGARRLSGVRRTDQDRPRLSEAPNHNGFRAPRHTEAELRDLYVWSGQILSVALRNIRPAQPNHRLSVRPSTKHELGPVADLFVEVALASGNVEHLRTVEQLNDRLAPMRRVEPEVLDEIDEEYVMLRDRFDRADRAGFARVLGRYHRRRFRAVPGLLAALTAGERS